MLLLKLLVLVLIVSGEGRGRRRKGRGRDANRGRRRRELPLRRRRRRRRGHRRRREPRRGAFVAHQGRAAAAAGLRRFRGPGRGLQVQLRSLGGAGVLLLPSLLLRRSRKCGRQRCRRRRRRSRRLGELVFRHRSSSRSRSRNRSRSGQRREIGGAQGCGLVSRGLLWRGPRRRERSGAGRRGGGAGESLLLPSPLLLLLLLRRRLLFFLPPQLARWDVPSVLRLPEGLDRGERGRGGGLRCSLGDARGLFRRDGGGGGGRGGAARSDDGRWRSESGERSWGRSSGRGRNSASASSALRRRGTPDLLDGLPLGLHEARRERSG